MTLTLTLDRYLSEVDASLPGPARDHSPILAELRAGLLDATDARVAAGLPHAEAVAAAIGEFGSRARSPIAAGTSSPPPMRVAWRSAC